MAFFYLNSGNKTTLSSFSDQARNREESALSGKSAREEKISAFKIKIRLDASSMTIIIEKFKIKSAPSVKSVGEKQ